MRPLIVGDIVKCRCDLLGNEKGSKGVVYENYQIVDGELGVSIIFENGGYDGFSPEEQNKFLDRVGHCPDLADYKFKNVLKVNQDYIDGTFDIALY